MSHIHEFIKSKKEGYEVCVSCGSYHSILQVEPKVIYQDNPYWGEDSGRSTWEQQISNMTCTDECGISKIDRVLQFVPKRIKRVLEIGASPGILLEKLLDMNLEVWGIEPKIEYCEKLAQQAKDANIVCGYFPEVTKTCIDNSFDCIIGLDVFEHVDDGSGFIKELHRLLTPNGIAILMSPIILEDGFVRDRDFVADQHCWIYTKNFLEPYLKSIFSEVNFSRWVVAHELIILKK